jgi:BON domain
MCSLSGCAKCASANQRDGLPVPNLIAALPLHKGRKQLNHILRGSWIVAIVLIASLVGCANSGEKSGAYVDDSWITTKVKSDLLATKDIHSTNISVKTTKGVVTLTGTAKTTEESNKAAQVARGVSGVTIVENDIRVE